MNDQERAQEIARLTEQLADARSRQAAIAAEMRGLAEWVKPIREAFGNPFFYSGGKVRRERAGKTEAEYTAAASHDVVGQLAGSNLHRWRQLAREIQTLEQQLQTLNDVRSA